MCNNCTHKCKRLWCLNLAHNSTTRIAGQFFTSCITDQKFVWWHYYKATKNYTQNSTENHYFLLWHQIYYQPHLLMTKNVAINTCKNAMCVLTFDMTLPSVQTNHSANLFECDCVTRLKTMHLIVQGCHNSTILLNHNHSTLWSTEVFLYASKSQLASFNHFTDKRNSIQLCLAQPKLVYLVH